MGLWRSHKPIMSSKYINISLYYGFKGGVRIGWSPPKKEKNPLGRKLSPFNFRIYTVQNTQNCGRHVVMSYI
jgi:hypothetical protein